MNRFSAASVWSGAVAHRWFILTAVVLLGLGAWQGLRILLGPAVVVDQVVRARLVETVVASGHVETPYRVEIGSQITGTVEDVLVQEARGSPRGSR